MALPSDTATTRADGLSSVDLPRHEETDLSRLVRLHEIGARSVHAGNLEPLLRAALDTVIAVTHADCGHLQLIDSQASRLRTQTERGLPMAFVRFFDAAENVGSTWTVALEQRRRIVAPDVRVAPEYTAASRRVMLDSGILSTQSTPLLSRSGEALGVISTHFRVPHRCTEIELQLVDLVARQAADFIEYSQRRRELQDMCARERTERVRAEAANDSKDQFLAMLAHELRQPLSAAFPAIEVQKRSLSPERRQRAGEVIAEQLAHLARLVEDLADASRMMRGTIELQREPVDLRTILQQALDMTAPSFQRRQHALQMDLGDGPVRVSGDATRLKQVFSNLLQNASSYTPAEGIIHGTLSVDRDQAVFRLRDNGVGIPAEALERIFDLFERGEHDASSPSVGIGLALVRRLVELHGGSVHAVSDGPGRGSEFTVTLPLMG